MERRMYRGNMGNRSNSPYRPHEPVCSDIAGGYKSDEMCEKDYGVSFDKFPLGMCYVPWQCFSNLYENEFVALANGTLFKDLDLDWYGRGCK